MDKWIIRSFEMKTVLSILAWFGILLILPGLLLSYSSSWFWVTRPGEMGADGYFVTGLLGGFGAVFAIIGWFFGRPKYFGAGAIVVDIAYIVSFYGGFVHSIEDPGYLLYVILTLVPGIVILAFGIWVSKLRRKSVVCL